MRFEPGRAPSFLSPWCPPGAAAPKNIHWTNMLLFSITPLICRYFLLMGIVKNSKLTFPLFADTHKSNFGHNLLSVFPNTFQRYRPCKDPGNHTDTKKPLGWPWSNFCTFEVSLNLEVFEWIRKWHLFYTKFTQNGINGIWSISKCNLHQKPFLYVTTLVTTPHCLYYYNSLT